MCAQTKPELWEHSRAQRPMRPPPLGHEDVPGPSCGAVSQLKSQRPAEERECSEDEVKYRSEKWEGGGGSAEAGGSTLGGTSPRLCSQQVRAERERADGLGLGTRSPSRAGIPKIADER